MSSYHKDIATAAEVTLETRAAVQARIAESSVASFLSDEFVDTEEFQLNVNEQQGTASAVYRAFDTEAPFGRESAVYSLSGKIPPISQKMMLSERNIRDNKTRLRERVMEHAVNNGLAIATRSILARGEVLETGKFVAAGENGLHFEIDFARPANHNQDAGTLWDATADVDVLGDLLAWKELYRATNGTDPGTVVISSRVMAALTRNTAIINVAAPGVTTAIVNPDAVRGVLAMWGFANIVVNDEIAVTATGAQSRVLSDNKVIFLPAEGSSLAGTGLGRTTWGSPSEAYNREYGIGGDVAGAFGGVFSRTDPEGLYVLGSALALPVLSNARATLVATVLSE